MLKLLLQAIAGRETWIGILAVLGFCALLSFGMLLLSWAGYHERYGIGLSTFLEIYF